MRIVAICGKAGVGKSSLAVRDAHQLREAFPDGHLYADMDSRTGDNHTPRLLGRFLRALGVDGSSIPEDLSERAEMYRSRLANMRILVLLAEVVAEEQVLPMPPGSPTCAVIVTCRSRLGGLSGGHRVDVGVLDMDEWIELLDRVVGEQRVRADWEETIRLVDLCGGLPLALRIAGARLASRPDWRIGGLVRRRADESRRLDEVTHHGLALRSSIDLAYRGLGGQAQRLVRLCTFLLGSRARRSAGLRSGVCWARGWHWSNSGTARHTARTTPPCMPMCRTGARRGRRRASCKQARSAGRRN
ncbi:NB-ARC domain-containing protein [Streptomyces shenzhenensis]|uniref:NB-ARC domain-containing protein n=1 Tax=Streptomyces shenzhenensis TaxID=943815 RepID=UPI00368D272D